jgi:hypothetical protein
MALLGFADTSGVCADCMFPCWYDINNKCLPGPLVIILPKIGALDGCAVNFNGRGKVGNNLATCATDTYVTVTTSSESQYSCAAVGESGVNTVCLFKIDVLKALRDGIWTSSVGIDVYYGKTGAADTSTRLVSARPTGASRSDPGTCACVDKRFTTQVIASLTCANVTTIQATVTVYDDGTLSIA